MNCFLNTYNRVQLLDDFAKRVANKEYQKVPYAIWRKMAHTQDPFLGVSVNADRESANVCILGKGLVAYENIGDFDREDESFGTYLYEHLNEMTPEGASMYNNTSSSWKYESNTATCGNNITVDSTGYPIWSDSTQLNNWAIASDIPNEKRVRDIVKEILTEKEEKTTMQTNDMFKFDFGPVSSNLFRMSPYGIAVATRENGWVSYNAKTGEIFDVDILNFDISKMIYKMPVALSAIAAGDILMHSGKPVFVRSVNGDGTVSVVDYSTATVTNILPVKSPFGFNFFTKVTALFDMSGVTASADNPFGNMLPFLMLSGESNGSFDPTLLFLAGSMGNMDFSQNPMMLYLLMNREDRNDILPFLMMMNGGLMNAGTPTATATT